MLRWSGMRKKLETDYLAPSLRGHIRYYVTTYSKSPDHNGRAAIRFDGEEILRGSYWGDFLQNTTWEESLAHGSVFSYKGMPVDEYTIRTGTFDQKAFYGAFETFDSQRIEDSLQSADLLVRIFALLDRRCGKRRLAEMENAIRETPEILQRFYQIRCAAEGLQPAEEAAS